MTLPPLNTPIAHNGSPECPVHPETRVMIIIDETADMTPEMFDAALAIKDMRAPADRIAELEAALRWYQAQFCEGICTDFPDHYYHTDCSGCKARAALKGTTDV